MLIHSISAWKYLLSLFIWTWIEALFSLKRPITYHFKSFFGVFLLFSARIRNAPTRPYLLNLYIKSIILAIFWKTLLPFFPPFQLYQFLRFIFFIFCVYFDNHFKFLSVFLSYPNWLYSHLRLLMKNMKLFSPDPFRDHKITLSQNSTSEVSAK